MLTKAVVLILFQSFALPACPLPFDPTSVIIPTSSLPVTTEFSSGVPLAQSTSTSAEPGTVGEIHTSLESSGRGSAGPFESSAVYYPTVSIKIPTGGASLKPPVSLTSATASGNIFVPIATNAPFPSQIPARGDVGEKGVGIVPQDGPLHTNKFYANLFLGDQTNGVWTHPYSLNWAKGGGDTKSWGLSVSHIERYMQAYGPARNPTGAVQYFVNPLGIQSIVLSAAELGAPTVLTTASHQTFSVNAQLSPMTGADPMISFPLVQGMGLVTAVYNKGTVLLQSGVFFRTLSFCGGVNNNATYKYRIVLEDGTNWLLYVTPNGAAGVPPFILSDSMTIRGPNAFQGSIQVAKNPSGPSGEVYYDASAGVYAISGSIAASVHDAVGNYKLSWKKAGAMTQTLLMFGLLHHNESMVPETKSSVTSIQLITTTKGMATAFLADAFKFSEPDLPVTIGFDPRPPNVQAAKFASSAASKAINNAASVELGQDMNAQSNQPSMYYSGKALSKFASMVYATAQLGQNSTLAAAGLTKLQAAYQTFIDNKQQFPLVYESVWRGAVSSATYATGDSGQDFGNSYYNDHHFHYGYFVYAAAVIGYLDPTWLTPANKNWVNMLVRDYGNGVESDANFPFSRNFDWYHGHSWAKGLFASADGKDEESTSEDAFSLYGMKMWGKVIGDANMEARGNLQLAVMRRALRNYFLMTSDNAVQPPKFVGNKVAGVFFENKADHTTYFGNLTEYVHGIQMLPISPISAYMRRPQFVVEEWNAYFSGRVISSINGGYRGLVMANLAIVDPQKAWTFFSDPNFDVRALDGGASLTWYLAYVSGMGGGP